MECPALTVDHLVDAVKKAACDFHIAACVGDGDIAYRPMDSLLQEMKSRPEFIVDDTASDLPAVAEPNVFYYVEPQGVHSYDYVFKYIRNALPTFFR